MQKSYDRNSCENNLTIKSFGRYHLVNICRKKEAWRIRIRMQDAKIAENFHKNYGILKFKKEF